MYNNVAAVYIIRVSVKAGCPQGQSWLYKWPNIILGGDLMRGVTIHVMHTTVNRGTQREYSSKPLKHSIAKRILVFKR